MSDTPHVDTDLNVRHFIYTTFAETTRPPTTRETTAYLDLTISAVEESLARLAEDHQIALVPGGHVLWMAHPFSALPTNFSAEVGGKLYWGN